MQRISNFEELSASAQIDYLAYYHLIILKQNEVKSRDIQKYFEELHIPEYSNIPAYLSKFTKRGRSQKFLKSSSGYKLATTRKKEIDEEAGNKPMPKPTDDLFPIEILDNTRQYLVKVAEQACICYDLGLYDASLVMVRKLVEALIIECFRKHGKEAEIKGSDGHYFFLSKLVDKYLNQNYWPVNRNTGKALPLIKNLGDLSAHNIRFSAKKPDLDKIKHDLRVVIEDIVLLIDYPNWK
ncbi:MAG: hypothetical protein ACPGU4_01345 [Flavobacteriales bacterium]